MNGIKWQKWTGKYNESLGQFGKIHAADSDTNTVCGVSIPDIGNANIEGESLSSVNCKKCRAKAEQYEKECREFDKENS